jgi:cation diffusion facilitator family transporter
MASIESDTKKLRAASFSVYVNVALLCFKSIIGILTGSLGILAEVAHTLLDLAASGFAYLGIKSANMPPDAEHQYGHDKYENLSSLIQTVLLAITCIWIFYEAISRLIKGFAIKTGIVLYYGMGVMAVTIIADVLISQYLFRSAKEYRSSALEADAYHFSTDMYSSMAVLAGLIASAFGYQAVDPIAAIVVALIMMFTSIKLSRRATLVLLDGAPPKEIIQKIEEVIRDCPEVLRYHSLRARMAGNNIYVDVSIHVSQEQGLNAAHGIADKLESDIKKRVPSVKESIVHIEPEIRHR